MKNMILKSVLLVILFAGISFGQDAASTLKAFDKDKNANKAFAVAKDAFEKGQVGEAQKILLIIKEYKKDAELYDLLAKVWEKFGVTDNAMSNYEEAELVDTKNIARKFILADMYYKADKIKECANKYIEIIKIDSTAKQAYLNLGNIFYKTKEYKADAAVYLEKALKFYDDIKIYKNCAKAYNDANNYAKAFEIADKASVKFPADVDFHRIAWQSAINTKKYEDALRHFGSVADSVLTAKEAKAAGDVANVLGKSDLNVKYYKIAAEKDPNNKDLFLNLADAAYNKGEYDKAIELYDKKLAIEPKSPKATQFKAYSYYKKEDYNNARGALLDWLAISDTAVSDYMFLANCYDKIDSTSRQVEVFNKILKLVNGKERQYKDVVGSINGFLGYRAYKAKSWTSAINYLKTSMAYKGEDLNLLLMVGGCYEEMKDYDNAVAYVKKAQKISPNNELVKKALRRMSAD